MNKIWQSFCGEDSNSNSSLQIIEKIQTDTHDFFIDPFSCKNHTFTIIIDLLIITICISMLLLHKPKPSRTSLPSLILSLSFLFIGSISLGYLGYGMYLLCDKTVFPLHRWLVLLLEGLKWMMLCLTLIIERQRVSKGITMKICSIVTVFQGGFMSISSMWLAILIGDVSVKLVLDVLSLPSSVLLLASTFSKKTGDENNGGLSEPLEAKDVKGDGDQARILVTEEGHEENS